MRKVYLATNHFVSRVHADVYYMQYKPNSLLEYVNYLLETGSIKIGKPEIEEGQSLKVNHEGRYEIWEEN